MIITCIFNGEKCDAKNCLNCFDCPEEIKYVELTGGAVTMEDLKENFNKPKVNNNDLPLEQ